jgi:hypothetical protein
VEIEENCKRFATSIKRKFLSFPESGGGGEFDVRLFRISKNH